MPEIREEKDGPAERNKTREFPKFFQITLAILIVLAAVYFASVLYVKVRKRASSLYPTDESSDVDDAFVKAKNPSIQVILLAPTADGIGDGYPSLTNLDRSSWYQFKLTKLNNTSDDKLLVSIDVRMSLKSAREHDLFKLWRSAHKLERPFDLRHAQSSIDEHLSNKITFKHEAGYQARFYWNAKSEVPLEIRFNVASCQFPFKQASNDLAFLFHVRVLRQSNLEIENYFSQIKLFWPSGAEEANHRANEQLWKATKQKLVPSSPYTNLTWYTNANFVLLNEPLLYNLQSANFESFQNEIDQSLIQQQATYNNMRYILEKPVTPFVNGSHKGTQFLGVFLEQNSSLSIKILLNLEKSKEFKQNSVIRNQFELNLEGHIFTKEELMNWYAKNDQKYLLEPDFPGSKVTSNVIDIRQNEINFVEMFWQVENQDEIVLNFKINSLSDRFEGKPFSFQIKSYLLYNSIDKNSIKPLDVATLWVFSVKRGQAVNAKKNWMKENEKRMKINPSDLPIAVLLLNHPAPESNFYKWLYVFVFTNLIRILGGIFASLFIQMLVEDKTKLDVYERISLGALIATIAFSFYGSLIVFMQLLIGNLLSIIGTHPERIDKIVYAWAIILLILEFVGFVCSEILWIQIFFVLPFCFLLHLKIAGEAPNDRESNFGTGVFIVILSICSAIGVCFY